MEQAIIKKKHNIHTYTNTYTHIHKHIHTQTHTHTTHAHTVRVWATYHEKPGVTSFTGVTNIKLS